MAELIFRSRRPNPTTNTMLPLSESVWAPCSMEHESIFSLEEAKNLKSEVRVKAQICFFWSTPLGQIGKRFYFKNASEVNLCSCRHWCSLGSRFPGAPGETPRFSHPRKTKTIKKNGSEGTPFPGLVGEVCHFNHVQRPSLAKLLQNTAFRLLKN